MNTITVTTTAAGAKGTKFQVCVNGTPVGDARYSKRAVEAVTVLTDNAGDAFLYSFHGKRAAGVKALANPVWNTERWTRAVVVNV